MGRPKLKWDFVKKEISEINGYMALDRAEWRERVILLTLIDWSHWTQGFV